MVSGIYEIRNKVNGKVYIGLSCNIPQRFLFHRRRLRDNTHKNKHLQQSYIKYGDTSFEFNVLEYCNEESLPERERYYIQLLKSHNREFGYNRTYGGEFGRLSDDIVRSTANKLRGRRLSEEMKARISKTLMGVRQSPEVISRRAFSCTKHTREILSYMFMAYIVSDDTVTETVRKFKKNPNTRKFFKTYNIQKMTTMQKSEFCFLGGTCGGSKWRDRLIPMLEVSYFNPVVEDWTPECLNNELHARISCDWCLYVITPHMVGVYSIAELVDDSNKRPDRTLFCFLTEDEGVEGFNEHQIKALVRTAELVAKNGVRTFQTLEELAIFLNNQPASL